MTTNEVLILTAFIVLAFLTFNIGKENKVLKQNNTRLTNDYKSLDSLYQNKSKRLKTYLLINIKQNEIIDKFQSSRNTKLKDVELMELQSKLN